MIRAAVVIAVLLFVTACTQNTRPNKLSENQKEDVALQKMAEAHNAKVKDPDQKVVCNRVTEIGSRISTLRCRTVWQMKEQAKEGRDFVNMPRPWATKDGMPYPP
jgi:hypothetical protein